MPTLQQLETALVNADRAGDSDAARRLAVAVRDARANQSAADQIPGAGPQVAAPPPPSLGERAVGAGEAALATISAPFAFLNGLAGGGNVFVKRLLAEAAGVPNPEQYDPGKGFEQASQALQYVPRTAQGQEQAGAVANFMEGLAPLAGMMGESAALNQSMSAARGAGPAGTVARAVAEGTMRDVAGPAAAAAATKAATAASNAASVVKQAAAALPQRTRDLIFGAEETKAAGTMGSAGASGTDLAAQRAATAENLPVPIKLTEGQRTRDFAQQRFEQETAKDPSLGAPLRENSALQNRQLAQNFEAMIDNVGATAPDMREAGRTVDSALVKAAARSKAEYRAKYNEAERAGELRDMVELQPLADYLNENRAGRTSAPILSTVADELGVKGVGGGSLSQGSVTAGGATLKQAEEIRKSINRFYNKTDPNDARVAAELRGIIDKITESAGGDLYQAARKARQRHAQLFEDNAIVSDLLTNRKNTADRRVALEDVFRRSILNGDRDSLGILRRTLDVSDQKAGFKPGSDGPGAQAWRELQGATLRHLLEESTKGVATDVAGNPIFSAAKLNNAVNALGRGGRLDFVLGKKNAQLVRDLNEVAKVVLTAPPGAVNTSNTASVVLAAIAEAGLTGSMTGLPLPVLSTLRAGAQFVKDVKVRRRVDAALNPGRRPQP